jgi:adenine-specific DNA-methyltransferase
MNRIIHGDCLAEMRQFPTGFADAIVTDPPYGIRYRSRKGQSIANDEAPFIWFLPEAYRVLKDGGAMLCFVRYDVEPDFRRSMTLAGFNTKTQIIWDKVVHGMGDARGDFAPQHENIIFATKGRFLFPGGRPKSVLRHQRVNSHAMVHPNEKPVSLMTDLITAVTRPGDLVLDPFLGSGTTAEAAKLLGRKYVGIELDRAHVEVARARLAAACSGSA